MNIPSINLFFLARQKLIILCHLNRRNKVNYNKDIEFNKQFKEVEEFNKSITSKSNIVSPSSYKTYPQAIYTSSRLLDYKNLPKPQNSKVINIQFYSGNYFF
jgi:hypothetical protein